MPKISRKNAANTQLTPNVNELIKLLLILPFSNAEVERAFSDLALTKTPHRDENIVSLVDCHVYIQEILKRKKLYESWEFFMADNDILTPFPTNETKQIPTNTSNKVWLYIMRHLDDNTINKLYIETQNPTSNVNDLSDHLSETASENSSENSSVCESSDLDLELPEEVIKKDTSIKKLLTSEEEENILMNIKRNPSLKIIRRALNEFNMDIVFKADKSLREAFKKAKRKIKRNHQCDYCGKVLENANALTQHQLLHNDGLKCPACEKTINYVKKKVTYHVRYHGTKKNMTKQEFADFKVALRKAAREFRLAKLAKEKEDRKERRKKVIASRK